MDKFKKVDKYEWEDFLKWYKNYTWYPIPMADRVNIYDKENSKLLIAYKYFLNDEYCILQEYYNKYNKDMSYFAYHAVTGE